MMKRILLLLLAFSAVTFTATAGDKNKDKKATTDKKSTATAAAKEIHWMSLDDVQAAMKKQPKKVLIDFYTGWCGWCKVMDRKTYSNPDVIKYINENFYAVKFDAERKDTVSFLNKEYSFKPEIRANEFAFQILNGQLSYPTTVVMMENFQTPQAIPGYLSVQQIEPILKYLNGNKYLTTKFEDFQKDFKAEFIDIPEPVAAPGAAPVSPH